MAVNEVKRNEKKGKLATACIRSIFLVFLFSIGFSFFVSVTGPFSFSYCSSVGFFLGGAKGGSQRSKAKGEEGKVGNRYQIFFLFSVLDLLDLRVRVVVPVCVSL